MLKHRVIPCLLLQNGGLVKTFKFGSSRYIGDPINAIRIFNEKEVDELLVLDIEASRTGREADYDLIEQFAGECFMPLSYGGGITNVEQASRLFSIGVEKVVLQSAAFKNVDILNEVASRYGSQSVIVSIDVKKNLFGKHMLYSYITGKVLKQSWLDFLKESVSAGAGEILLNSVDRDGTLSGMDLSLIETAASACDVPLIAIGGVGSLNDIKMAVAAGASAVSAGAYFVYHGKHRAVLITYPDYEVMVKLLDT